MHGFYTENRKLPAGISLSRDLTQHIFMRAARGPVVVISERPQDLAAVSKKQWHVLLRLVQRERASTLRATRIAELTNQITWMRELGFTARKDSPPEENKVLFITIEDAIAHPPICSTLYITRKIGQEQFSLASSWLIKNSVVVLYKIDD